MAPIEDLSSRDLGWISDFVMQQMVIMMRPMMDHLSETDAAADYAHRMVQRLSMDISELRGDLERTNKYLAILRQGLGVQNEGKCVLQRSLDGQTRTVKRVDEQMESMLSIMRGLEDSIGTLAQDARGDKDRQEELAKQVSTSTCTLDDMQAKVERLSLEAHTLKDDFLSNEARMEVWQKELREMRRGQLSVVTKLEEKPGRPQHSSQSGRAAAAEQAPWPQKKIFSAAAVEPLAAAKGGGGDTPGGFGGVTGGLTGAMKGFEETNSNHSGSSQQSKKVSRVGSGAINLSPQEHLEIGIGGPPRSASRPAVWSGVDGGRPPSQDNDDRTGSLGAGSLRGGKDDDDHGTGSRLPLLTSSRQLGGASRSNDRSATTDAGPRLRFSATMAKPESRGTPGL
eukprot:CAMPEP_0177331092 /NCGR_PEP_ID=MMETSP0368-20130122/20877_1 /TAXON_ID=447022 ORGANISM="Scrippsiella hangoei-like, Strain SHHI-4" /NCGR_SAMPLE_ID=MMETSP0368 /ASSEMBLY_ACC=CAM_ASM_000363 /LENGTH=396 /DNA_ID=CAMNT_0018791473 /DNA_START=134 /DNA_END=1324 /DNA_ORIENTATION=-